MEDDKIKNSLNVLKNKFMEKIYDKNKFGFVDVKTVEVVVDDFLKEVNHQLQQPKVKNENNNNLKKDMDDIINVFDRCQMDSKLLTSVFENFTKKEKHINNNLNNNKKNKYNLNPVIHKNKI